MEDYRQGATRDKPELSQICETPLLKSDGHGILRSGDDGRTWQTLRAAVAAAGEIDAVAAAAGGKALYAAGRGIGVLRSDDGGVNWTAVNDGLPSAQVTALAAHSIASPSESFETKSFPVSN